MSIVVQLEVAVYENAFGAVVNDIDTYTYIEKGSMREGVRVDDPLAAAREDAREISENCAGCEILALTIIDTQAPEWTSDHRRRFTNWAEV